MYYLTSLIIPSLQILKILGSTDKFLTWIKETHPNKNPIDLFEGYKFSVECCLSSFFDGISNDQILGIENDFSLDSALANVIPLHHLSNTCEKTILLKNLKPYVKSVLRTRSFNGLKQKYSSFDSSVSSKFDIIRENNLSIDSDLKIDLQTANKLCLIDFVHTHLMQIDNNGPAAFMLNPLNTKWITDKRLTRCFEGYKYALQFIWNEILGNKFIETHLVSLHLADSWRNYKYIKSRNDSDTTIDMFNREFKLEEQSSIDSYFYRIKDEVTDLLSDKYGFSIFTIDSHFQFNSSLYNKHELFSVLLEPIDHMTISMSLKEQINERLLGYPFSIINTRKVAIHLGTPSFNTMLAGTVALHNTNVSPFTRIFVCKFIHPHPSDNKKNDFSYGVLVDAKSAAGHFSSGWLLYQDTCSDYSGFSGSEYKSSEKLISKYLEENKIELRELTIPLDEFKKFTSESEMDFKEKSILEKNKLIPDIIQKSRAQLLEYLAFYVYSKASAFKNHTVKLNVDKNNNGVSVIGEKDVVIENKDEVIIVECKLNLQNFDINKLIERLQLKATSYSQRNKSCVIWSWKKLSQKNKKIIDSTLSSKVPVTYVEVLDPNNPILKGISLKDLKFVMQNYDTLD